MWKKNIYNMKKELGIIIVDYKSNEKTISYIKNELYKLIISKVIVIVNLCSTNESNIFLNKELESSQIVIDNTPLDFNNGIFILSSKLNLGYAIANNLGASFLLKYFEIEYFLFCNNDIKIISLDIIDNLIKKIELNPKIGCVGPKILGLDGEDQNPHKYISMTQKYFFRNLFMPFINRLKFRFDFNTKIKNADSGIYYRLSGCFILLKKVDFVKCGMFDENTFLYSEECILSERLAKISKFCYYDSESLIIHEQGVTIKKFLNKKKSLKQEFISDKYYYLNYKKQSNLIILFNFISFNLFLFLIFIKNSSKRILR